MINNELYYIDQQSVFKDGVTYVTLKTKHDVDTTYKKDEICCLIDKRIVGRIEIDEQTRFYHSPNDKNIHHLPLQLLRHQMKTLIHH